MADLENVLAMPGVDPEATADNVVELDMITRLDIPAERVLTGALAADLDQVFVVGYGRDGRLFTSASVADGAELLWMLELAKKRLLEIGSGDVPIEHLPGA